MSVTQRKLIKILSRPKYDIVKSWEKKRNGNVYFGINMGEIQL